MGMSNTTTTNTMEALIARAHELIAANLASVAESARVRAESAALNARVAAVLAARQAA